MFGASWWERWPRTGHSSLLLRISSSASYRVFSWCPAFKGSCWETTCLQRAQPAFSWRNEEEDQSQGLLAPTSWFVSPSHLVAGVHRIHLLVQCLIPEFMSYRAITAVQPWLPCVKTTQTTSCTRQLHVLFFLVSISRIPLSSWNCLALQQTTSIIFPLL